MTLHWKWPRKLVPICGLTIGIAACLGSAAEAQIVPDATLPINSELNQSGSEIEINGGTPAGSNLFHSFEEFSVPAGVTALFNDSPEIENIFTRVTGGSISNIDGTLATNDANLFLLNPNGIVFGPNASLDIGGSFLGTTASSFHFEDGTFFSATGEQSKPLLTVSAPIGLQFGEAPGAIVNRAGSPIAYERDGLEVREGETLALLGGDIRLEGGRLSAEGGRIELGSVGPNSQVSLTATDTSLALEYEGVQDFQDIELSQQALVDASGEGGGDIQVRSQQLLLSGGSEILSITQGSEPGGSVTVRASEKVELSGQSADGKTPSSLRSDTVGAGSGGDLIVDTRQLVVRDGTQVSAVTFGEGSGGHLIVVSESIKLLGASADGEQRSGLFVGVEEEATGAAGNLAIETRKLIVQNGAQVGSGTRGFGNGGSITVNASESVEVAGTSEHGASGIFANACINTGNGGNLRIATDKLIVRDGATINASSFHSLDQLPAAVGAAGNLEIKADFVLLENEASISAATLTGTNGSIALQAQNIQLRQNSTITTNANKNGGNITIETDTLVALEDSDIVARALDGQGGNIQINTLGDFRSSDSDIDASSERGIDGVVTIERPEIDPSSGLVKLEAIASESLIARGCSIDGGSESSQLINTRRGGIPENPGNPLVGDAFLDDFRPLEELTEQEIAPPLANPDVRAEISEPILEEPIVEAQGWRRNDKGEIVLIAESSASYVNSSWRSALGCDGHVSYLLHYKDSPAALRLRSGRTGSGLTTGSGQGVRRGDSRIASTTSLPAIANKANTAPETFAVEQFQFAGNTAFSSEELAKVTKPFANRELSFEELIQARTAVSDLYIEAGYVTSGALIPPQTVKDGTVEIKLVEGRLEDIDVKVSGRLDPNYIRDRLARGNREILNINDLVSTLQLLKLDEGLIERISAELSALPRPGRNRLEVQVQESPPFSSQFTIDNRRSPSVGSFRRSARLNQTNLSGIGDRLSLGYSNTDGSNSWDLGYSLPINSRNGTLSFSYSNGDSKIIEPPFDELDIEASSRSYELNLRQPIIQRVKKNGRMREVALGLRASRQESTTTILGGEGFPLSPGADANGETDVSALRFYQEWTERDSQQVLAARSEFSLGVGAFDGDSIFFGWRGQGQWARRLGKDSMLLLKGNAQFSPNALASSEQFGIGGLDSVRGYRQDTLLADNGVLASAELRLPVYRLPKGAGVLQIAPFVDLGAGWNSDGRDNPATNVLMSAGVGLQFQLGNKLSTRIDWGIPLIDTDSRNRTWQENGFYFSINYNPF